MDLFTLSVRLLLQGRKEVERDLDRTEKRLDRVGKKTYSPSIEARTEAADKKIDALGNKLERLDAFRAEAEADVDTANGLRSLDALESQLDGFAKEVARARADVQTTEGQRQLRDLEGELLDFRKQTATARARIETSGQQELTGLAGLLQRFAGTRATAKADVDADGGELTGLMGLLSRFGATNATARIGINGGAASVAQLGAVNAAADRVDGRNINLGFNPSLGGIIDRVNSGLQQTATRIRAFSTVGSAAAIPVLIAGIAGIVPVATAAAAALGGLASAVTQGLVGAFGAGGAAAGAFAAGIGLIAGAAAPTINALSEHETATNALQSAQQQAKSASQAYADAQRGVQDASRGVADAQRSASEGVAAAQATYQDALRGVADAEEGVAEAARGVGEARREANAGVAQAQQAYQDSLRGVEDAERALADAARGVGEARREASAGVAEAQRAYQDSLRSVEDAERDLADSRRTLNDATRELRGAQMDLNQAMQDEPRNQAYATLDLADARDRASDATREYNEAVQEYGASSEEATDADRRRQRAQLDLQQTEQDVADTRRNGSDELQSAREGVESASEAERSARQGVADSERGLQDARRESAEAYAGIAAAEREGAQGIADAQRQVADAQRGVAEANRAAGEAAAGIEQARIDGAQRVADAQQQVADAQRDVQDAVRTANEAQAGIEQARVDGARQVADAQRQVADAQRAVQQAAEANTLAQQALEAAGLAVGAKLTASQQTLLDKLREVGAQYRESFRAANDAFNYLATDILTFASGALPALGRASEASIGALGRAFGTLRAELSSGAQLGVFRTALAAIPGFVQTGTEAIGRLGMTVANTFTAAIPAGQRLFASINGGLENLAAYTRSAVGQQELTAYFNQAYDKAVILGGGLRDLVAGFIGLGGAFDESGLSGRMLQGFADMGARFRDFTAAGSAGRAMLVDFSRAAQPTLDATWRLLGAIFTEWGRVANALVRARDEAGKLIVPEALNGIRDALPVIGNLLIDTFTRFGPIIGPLVAGVAGLLNAFVAHNPVLQRLSEIVVGVLTAFNNLPGPVKTVIVSVASLASIGSVLGLSLAGIITVGTTVAGVLGGPLLLAIGAVVGGAALLTLAAAAIKQNWGRISGVFSGLTPIISRVMTTLRNLGTVIRGLFTGNTGTEAFKRSFASLPGPVQNAVKLIVIAWRGLKTAFAQAWAEIRPILTQIGNGLKTGLSAAFNFALSQGRSFINWFRAAWPGIRSAVMPVLTAIGNGLRTVLVGAFKFALQNGRILVNWFRQNWPLIRQTAMTVFNAVKTIVTGAFRTIMAVVRPIITGLVNFWRQNSNQILSVARSVWNIVKTTIQTAIRAVLGIIKAVMQVITGDWRGAWNTIRGVIAMVWRAIQSNIRNAINIIRNVIQIAWNAIRSLTQTVWNAIRTVLQTVWNAIRSVVQSGIQRARSVITSGWNAIKNLTSTVWNAIRNFLTSVWNRIKSVVSSALSTLKQGITKAFNDIRNFTTRIWNSVRDTITNTVRKARENALRAINYLKDSAMRIFESMPNPIQRIFQRIRDFISDPIGTAVANVRGFLYDLIGMVNRVLKAVGLKEIGVVFGQGGGGPPPDSGGRNGSRRGLAKGGVTTDPNMGEAFARGGVSAGTPLRRFADGGMGTPGKNPRMHLWNEQQGGEAFIAQKRPAKEQLPYLQTAADWHGYAVVPSKPTSIGKHHDFAEGGLVDVRPFAFGGASEMHSAVLDKFGVNGFNNHGSYLSEPAASRSIDWMVTTPGNRATGSQKELGDNIAAFTQPPSAKNTIWYGSANFGGGWQGYNTGPGVGNSNTLGHYDHVHAEALGGSFKGGQGGGGIGGMSVPNPKQALFEKTWNTLVKPLVDRIIKPLEESRNRIVNIAGAAGRRVPKGVYSWIDEKIPDMIGGDGSTGATGNFSGSKKDMAMTFAKNAVSRGMPGRLPVMTSMQELGGYWFGNTDDYRSVTGYSQAADHDSLGFFQQRPSTGWGSPEQIMDPAYALGKFLSAAEGFKGRYSNDPGGLSAWAQAVQRSAFPGAYAKHWDAAGKVIGDPKYYEKGGMVPGREGEAKMLMAHAGEIILPAGLSKVFVKFSETLKRIVDNSPLKSLMNSGGSLTARQVSNLSDKERFAIPASELPPAPSGYTWAEDRTLVPNSFYDARAQIASRFRPPPIETPQNTVRQYRTNGFAEGLSAQTSQAQVMNANFERAIESQTASLRGEMQGQSEIMSRQLDKQVEATVAATFAAEFTDIKENIFNERMLSAIRNQRERTGG